MTELSKFDASLFKLKVKIVKEKLGLIFCV
jgi:hypothetical protein